MLGYNSAYPNKDEAILELTYLGILTYLRLNMTIAVIHIGMNHIIVICINHIR